MDEVALLTFRLGTTEYGVPLDAISGVACTTIDIQPTITGFIQERTQQRTSPIPIFEMHTKSNDITKKLAIILNIKETQIALLVDEILQVKELGKNNDPAASLTSFNIWRFDSDSTYSMKTASS